VHSAESTCCDTNALSHPNPRLIGLESIWVAVLMVTNVDGSLPSLYSANHATHPHHRNEMIIVR
jgi:hypothetical protein